jgi:opacity protein-like surface antigen
MKKLILVAAITAVGFASKAQVTFGVKAGLNIANLTGDVSGTSSLTSFNAGGLVNIPISSMFSVQPEVVYSGEGAKFDGGKDNLNYINIPVLFQYNNSGFFGEVGPQIGLLTSAKEKPDSGPSTDIKDGLKSTNFSLVFGAGYKLTNGLGFNVRYNLGLSNIVDGSGGDVKSSVFQVGAFFAFGGAKSKD